MSYAKSSYSLSEVIREGNPHRESVRPETVKHATDEAAAINVVRMGFGSDPVARWVYPDPVNYLSIFPDFIRAFAGGAFREGTAFITEGNTGAALWLPPGVTSDEERIMEIIDATTSEAVRIDLIQVFEQMAEFHPDGPHWYLPMIAVDPFRQGNGIGSLLLKASLNRCDAEGMPAYLESSNPKNISLYQRFGFELIGIIQSGGSPPLFPMLRRSTR